MQRKSTPTFGEPEREAWTMVLDAIEEAMEVEDLSLFDRGQLVNCHDWAAWHIGVDMLRVPEDWEPAKPPTTGETAGGPGGTCELRLGWVEEQAVIRAGLLTVEQVRERAAAGTLTELAEIGPKRAANIEAAIKQWEREHEPERTTR